MWRMSVSAALYDMNADIQNACFCDIETVEGVVVKTGLGATDFNSHPGD